MGSEMCIRDRQNIDKNLTEVGKNVVPEIDDVDALLVSKDEASEMSSQIVTDDRNINDTNSMSSEKNASEQEMVQEEPEILEQYKLPEGTIEEQYNFAVKLALAKKLEEARGWPSLRVGPVARPYGSKGGARQPSPGSASARPAQPAACEGRLRARASPGAPPSPALSSRPPPPRRAREERGLLVPRKARRKHRRDRNHLAAHSPGVGG